MDEKTKKMIEWYIPSDPDQELEESQYYLNQGNRIIKVFPLDILPHKDGTKYGCYQKQKDGGRLKRITGEFCFWELYDNKTDCKNMTHIGFDDWEELRIVQKKEGNNVR